MATSLSEARSEGARHVLAGGALKDLIGLEPHELEGIYTIAYTELNSALTIFSFRRAALAGR